MQLTNATLFFFNAVAIWLAAIHALQPIQCNPSSATHAMQLMHKMK